jgi:hypothetical protein
MEQYTFVVEYGHPDDDGYVIDPSGVIGLPMKVPIIKDSDNSSLGKCLLYYENWSIKCKAKLPKELIDLVPAIGVAIIEIENNRDKGIKTITKCCAIGVTLCPENADIMIDSIRKQTNQ